MVHLRVQLNRLNTLTKGVCVRDSGCLEAADNGGTQLRCGVNNCPASLGLPDGQDCCTSLPCDAENGHGRCCTPKFQCDVGEGDCDKQSHCKAGTR